jgi:hypothetical protein
MTVKNLTVTVTYTVGLGDVEMPQEVYEQLLEAHDNGNKIDPTMMIDNEAEDWVTSKISERDCMDWECEIDDIT